jgi:hypothetical protein
MTKLLSRSCSPGNFLGSFFNCGCAHGAYCLSTPLTVCPCPIKRRGAYCWRPRVCATSLRVTFARTRAFEIYSIPAKTSIQQNSQKVKIKT